MALNGFFHPSIKCDHQNQGQPALLFPWQSYCLISHILEWHSLEKGTWAKGSDRMNDLAMCGLCGQIIRQVQWTQKGFYHPSRKHWCQQGIHGGHTMAVTERQARELNSSRGHGEHNHPGACYNADSAQLGLRREPRFCISKKSPSDTHAATPPFEQQNHGLFLGKWIAEKCPRDIEY